MDYLIGAICLISFVINLLVYKRITATYPLGVVEELEPAPYLESSEQEEVNEFVPEKKHTEAYQAWTNRQGIPWTPPTKAPEPIVKAPNRGPLARPDGFV